MFRRQQLPQVCLPCHALVSDRPPWQCSPVAACAVAATSPYYFWHPFGLQSAIVAIWQHHIRMWSEGNNIATVQQPPEANSEASPNVTEVLPAERKGHLLQPIPDGTGMFCVKCGIYTSYHKHVRSKILKHACRFSHLPPSQWLTKPGMQQANSRLDEEELKLKEERNKPAHDLIWNRKVGRDESKPDTYGWIFCHKCCRTWPWCKRHANIPRSICRETSRSQPTPQGVLDMHSPNPPNVTSEAAPRKRIRGKTTPNPSNRNTHEESFSHIDRDPSAASPAGIYTHKSELALDSQLFACSGDAVCIVAATSPYYFWHPFGLWKLEREELRETWPPGFFKKMGGQVGGFLF